MMVVVVVAYEFFYQSVNVVDSLSSERMQLRLVADLKPMFFTFSSSVSYDYRLSWFNNTIRLVDRAWGLKQRGSSGLGHERLCKVRFKTVSIG